MSKKKSTIPPEAEILDADQAETTAPPVTTTDEQPAGDVAAETSVSSTEAAAAAEPETTETTAPPVTTTNESEPVEVPVVKPHHEAFFDQYIEFIKGRQPNKAILALNNSIKAMLKKNTATAFGEVLKLFRDNQLLLNSRVVLQSAATLPPADRAIVEIITTVFHVMITKQNTELNLEMVRTITKNEAFVNWCAKKLK